MKSKRQKPNRPDAFQEIFSIAIQQGRHDNWVKVILPITTIYILGFKLPEIDLMPCLRPRENELLQALGKKDQALDEKDKELDEMARQLNQLKRRLGEA